MRFHHLDLNLLVALDAILTEKNVTRAADKLCISQSAASGLLARLREFFDDDLLLQSGRQMVATPFALTLEEPVKRVLLDIQTNIVSGKSFSPEESNRHFRFMASDYVTTVFLADVFHKLSSLAPNMTFDVLQTTNHYDEALTRGEIDFLIQPNAYMNEHHPHELLFDDQYVCVVCENNTKVGNSISIEKYLELGHVVINLGENRAPSFEESFAQKFGKERHIEVSTSNFNTLPHLLIGTNRIAVMQSRLAHLYLPTLPIKILDTPESIPALTEHIQWNKVMDNDPAHRWLREVCLKTMQ
ncbi:LysR family transcriptional regulator [Marinomonas mediterranea]|jgi:Transcriptional regulator|uniref:Transcriptional regulator, LysR family n=1 Tax=Marinomonas mediterranea (strain ATCC 700492 / JCM 21426 / NBRC 103028 / MMB-1) TaxID=717774 RepID=F2JZE4_MARM1|nr:LysR family transcriptional regulator [Marinomonas mediterranea]ADZ89727.1 transcriptional regulator, LysR family [Marinomonas mediterranea MMB-1]WCN07821.1 LysR family transcriptional regulator [Marinomonas mediterranea]WCN11915.1 LysR family transcriptional regulator [Marinomonas mediterranea]WCN15953.1 LysR family transcriptional regulator [Marinomonas mediterranea MMB-1]